MAVLAIGLVGAAAGGAFGYASIGWMVGTTVGALLFQEKQKSIREGPRLNDLRVQASTYGVGVPIAFGSVRIAGNIIWSGGIREIGSTSTEEVGKGGGQEVTTRSYAYLANFAIALCQGPVVGIRRVWADGELIYYSNATDLSQASGSGLGLGAATFYPGSETQLPNPTMESFQGVGNVPAHRGMCYVVFTDADITRWGRIPNLEFEVVLSGSEVRPTAISVTGNSSQAGYLENGLYYTARTDTSVAPSTTTVFRTLSSIGSVLSEATWTNTTFGHSGTYGTNIIRGNILGLCCAAASASTIRWIRALSDGSYVATQLSFPDLDNTGMPIEAWRIGNVVMTSHRNGVNRYIDFVGYDSVTGLPESSPWRTITFSCGSTTEANRWKIAASGSYFYVANFNTGTYTRGLRKYDTSGNLIDSWTFTTLPNADFAQFAIVDDLYFVWKITSGTNGFLVRLITGGTSEVINDSHTITQLSISSVSIPTQGIVWSDSGAANLLPSITKSGAVLSTIVSSICELSGLDASDINVAALTDTVNGYVITRPMTARAAIEALAKAYFFDAVESDNRVKFVKRGGGSVITIPAVDLGAVEQGKGPADLIKIERSDEIEAPRQVIVQFWNNDGSYAQATEYARRLLVRSVEQVFEELPLVLTSSEGAMIAEMLLYAAHMGRNKCEWATSIKYAQYEPTDIFTLEAGSPFLYSAGGAVPAIGTSYTDILPVVPGYSANWYYGDTCEHGGYLYFGFPWTFIAGIYTFINSIWRRPITGGSWVLCTGTVSPVSGTTKYYPGAPFPSQLMSINGVLLHFVWTYDPGALTLNVHRSSDGGASFTRIGTATNTPWGRRLLTDGTTIYLYHYDDPDNTLGFGYNSKKSTDYGATWTTFTTIGTNSNHSSQPYFSNSKWWRAKTLNRGTLNYTSDVHYSTDLKNWTIVSTTEGIPYAPDVNLSNPYVSSSLSTWRVNGLTGVLRLNGAGTDTVYWNRSNIDMNQWQVATGVTFPSVLTTVDRVLDGSDGYAYILGRNTTGNRLYKSNNLSVTATRIVATRITKKREDGQRIVWEGELDSVTSYASSASGGTVQDDDLTIATVGPTVWELLDIPILRDQDDDFGYYAGIGGLYVGWRGAALFEAPDDANFAQVGSVSVSTAIGTATSALGNFLGGNVFDELSSVTIDIIAGEVTSATETQVLSGTNHGLLGSEIIAFKTATLVSGTTYRLTGMLRGCFGTEQHMATHASGDRFVLVGTDGIIRLNRPSSELNTTRYVKAASFGQSLAEVVSKSFSNSGIGKKPLSPVFLRGSRDASSDLIVTWVRRTRIGGEWRDYVDASLGETTESYEIDIRNAGDTATLRTLTATTQTVTYTAAQQTTDFGSPQSSINVKVYQLSSTVGRGFPVSGAI